MIELKWESEWAWRIYLGKEPRGQTWDLIHTDVCGPFPPCIGREKKVLCYIYHLHITTLGMGYVYLLHEKEEALTAFHLRSSRQR